MVILLVVLTLVVFVIFNLLPGDPARLACGKSCTPLTQPWRPNPPPPEYDISVWEQYFRFLRGLFWDAPTVALSLNRPPLRGALSGLFLPAPHRRARSPRALLPRHVLAHRGWLLHLDRDRPHRRHLCRCEARSLAGPHTDGHRAIRLLDAIVLHRPRVVLIHHLAVAPAARAEVCPAGGGPGRFRPDDAPAVDRDRRSATTTFSLRLTRNQVLETFSEDYVRTARAKGLPERKVVVRHALRAGLTPIVTAAGLDIAYLLGGADHHREHLQPPDLAQGSDELGCQRCDLPVIAAVSLRKRWLTVSLSQPDRRPAIRGARPTWEADG